jgi:hypothetical protein
MVRDGAETSGREMVRPEDGGATEERAGGLIRGAEMSG